MNHMTIGQSHDHPDRSRSTSLQEGPMFDRDRFLATDHEARLHAEAEARRQVAAVRAARPPRPTRRARALRTTIGHWLVTTGSRLAPEPDPCGPARPRTA